MTQVAPMTYDVFISYSTHQQAWVEVLARNLKRHGVEPFLDKWRMMGGERLQAALARDIANSRAGILIATPESWDSGWVQQEYARLSARAREEAAFRLIPIAFGKMPPFDFIEDRLAIQFDDATPYEWAFHSLLCALRGEPPGEQRPLGLDVELPEPVVGLGAPTGFINYILGSIAANRALLLLAQADAVDGDAAHELVQQISRDYNDYTLHDASAPMGDDADRYFTKLARRCQLGAGVNNAEDFETAIDQRLEGGEKVFLVLRGFENGPAQARRQMAQILRELYDNHRDFRVVISGADQLAQLYFVDHDVSPLRFARFERWPEYSGADIANFYRQLYGEPLDAAQAEVILAVSGGHLGLIRECLQLRRQHGGLEPAAYSAGIATGFVLDRIVAPVTWKPDLAAQFRQLTESQDLGLAFDHLTNPALRGLYWWNLLVRRDGRLHWRCDAIRHAVARLAREAA